MAIEDLAPAACTLPSAQRPTRLAEFDAFFADVRRWSRPHRTRLDLVIAHEVEEAGRDLAARESACCSFFSFKFESREADVVMAIGVPLDYVDVLDAVEARVRKARLGAPPACGGEPARDNSRPDG